MELRRFERAISKDELPSALKDPAAYATEGLDLNVDLSSCVARAAKLVAQTDKAGPERAKWDAELAEELHQSLGDLSRSLAADMRLWHWLCIVPFREFVWHRWTGSLPSKVDDALSSALSERFVGSATLRGVSRNTLARLYWCATALWNETEGYRWVRAALSNQDFFQNIFERKLGLYRPASVAALKELADEDEATRRTALVRLNHYATTITLEALSEDAVRELLRA